MKKTKSYYFKKTFYLVFAFMFTFTIVRGLFDVDFSTKELMKLFFVALTSSIITGALIGFINMQWFKRDNFFKKQD